MWVAKRSRNHLSWEMMMDVPAMKKKGHQTQGSFSIEKRMQTKKQHSTLELCERPPAKLVSASSRALSVSTSRSFSGSSWRSRKVASAFT